MDAAASAAGWAVRAVPLRPGRRPVPPPLRISHVFCLLDRVRRAAERGNCEIIAAGNAFFAEKNVTLKNLEPEISSRMSVDKVDKRLLGPVLAGFFIMGFCDMVAPITGRIAAEFPPGQQAAVSFLPTMVFLWFLVLSTPVAALMNRWGRKATALSGLRLHRRGADDALCRRRGLRSGVVFRGLRSAGRRQHGDPRWPSTLCWRPSFPASG